MVYEEREATTNVTAEGQIDCPICGSASEARKVSGIVSAGTTHAWAGTYSAQSSTTLASQLSPPPEPEYEGSKAGSLILGWLFFGGGAALFATLGPTGWVMAAVFVAVPLAGTVGFMRQNARRGPANKAKYAEWQLALSRWNRLYYCYRDDVVYLPGSAQFVEKTRLAALLYAAGQQA